jgi:hypothetical protein
MAQRARFWSSAAVVIGAALMGGVAAWAQSPAAPPPAVPPAAPAAPQQPGAAAPAPAAAPSPNVRIVFTVLPSTKKATVMWGKKRLGVIEKGKPLIVTRPRDSGPLDVIVRAEGCLSVQTRAYTFADSKVAVKVTPPDQKNTLLGFREELSPDGGVSPSGGPDGGVR